MSQMLDERLEQTGTRFRIYPLPRYVDPNVEPETVHVSVPEGTILAGPADDRMYVVDAVQKQPYNRFTGPPYLGPSNPPVNPSPEGHFDHLDEETRGFLVATMYATVRRALDIWEDYFEHTIQWHFESDFSRLELIPLIEWDNAQSGYGFLEFGYGRTPLGGIDHSQPYCENFDVLAHELGHSIIFTEVGVPSNPADPAIDYGGMHESAGDLVAIVSVLHFHTVVDRLLGHTSGNLFTVNELDRVGELAGDREIRVAFNNSRMSDVGTEPHDRSLPLTGGIFDIMVEVFQKTLVEDGLISQDLADRSTHGFANQSELPGLQAEFRAAYSGHEAGFKAALLSARDYLGRLLAVTWGSLNPPNFLTYAEILRALLRADRDARVSGGLNQETIRSCFAWREISQLPDSLLLRPRTLRECGLLAQRPALGAAPAPMTPANPARAASRTVRKGKRRAAG